jgi:beta-lactamase regulating signal transducer with metallopeptidase domain
MRLTPDQLLQRVVPMVLLFWAVTIFFCQIQTVYHSVQVLLKTSITPHRYNKRERKEEKKKEKEREREARN